MLFLRGGPGFLDDSLEEEVGKVLNGLDEALVGEFGCPQQFGFDVDSIGGVSLDVGVILYEHDGETVE